MSHVDLYFQNLVRHSSLFTSDADDDVPKNKESLEFNKQGSFAIYAFMKSSGSHITAVILGTMLNCDNVMY